MEIPAGSIFFAGMAVTSLLIVALSKIFDAYYKSSKRYFFFTYTCYDHAGAEQARGNGTCYTDDGKFPSQESLKILISEHTGGSTYSFVKFESIEEWDEDDYNEWLGKDE